MDHKSRDIDWAYQSGQFIGQYRIVQELGLERFTASYLGTSVHDRTPLVIKVLRPPLLSELQKDFLAEAQAIMALRHPAILPLRDAGVDNHYPFVITDYVAYLTLRQAFPPGSIQPLANFLPYLKQIASALQYAHGRNILHGDIRPETILLNRENQILLSGFTIEAITRNQEQFNYMKRESIAYTAPESLQGKMQPASDQYSLAVIVYELLAGEVPFSKSYFATAQEHLNAPPPSLRAKVPDISSRIDRIVMTALAKDPARRFNNVQAFVNALEQAQYAQSPAATSYSVAAPPVQPQPVRPSPVVSAPVPSPSAVFPPVSPVAVEFRAPAPPSPQPSPVPPAPVIQDSPPAQRRENKNTITRRAFAFGLIGLAVAGGAGGWYVLSERLAKAAPPPVSQDSPPPATRTTINNTNVLIFTGHLASVNAVTWSPDGKLIASGSDDTYVQVFDAVSGKRKLIYTGHTEEVAAVAWSPDGRYIASGSQDATAQVWNAVSKARILVYRQHADRVNSVSWSSDSRLLASGSDDRTVQVWDAFNGTVDFDFQGDTAGVLCVGWQPDNSSVASGSWDGTLRDWATVQHGDHFNAGDQIFSYDGHGTNEVYALSWSPDGNFIASAGADQTVQISSGVDGTPRLPFFTAHRGTQHVKPVRAVAWSPDGNYIASGDSDGVIYVWRVAGRKIVFTYRGHKGAVNALSWSPDGKRIASASADTTVQVWQPGLTQ